MKNLSPKIIILHDEKMLRISQTQATVISVEALQTLLCSYYREMVKITSLFFHMEKNLIGV